jgi:hypothetical protein
MIASSTADNDYIPHFSGHETFPLRNGWLKKAYDQVGSIKPEEDRKAVFVADDAIARFGVGKNMVSAIRHWALACDVIRESGDGASYEISPYASKILTEDGWDPYFENINSVWYAHWRLCSLKSRATTWYWLFNRVTAPRFSRTDLETPLAEFASSLSTKRKPSEATLARDIDTCIRSYSPRIAGVSPEDFAEPLLGELSLIREEYKGQFAFQRGPKSTLHTGVFAFALIDYWDKAHAGLSSLSFESILYGDGAPGRVFKLDEASVAERLLELDELSKGQLSWTDTAGLRQIHRRQFDSDKMLMKLLSLAYE